MINDSTFLDLEISEDAFPNKLSWVSSRFSVLPKESLIIKCLIYRRNFTCQANFMQTKRYTHLIQIPSCPSKPRIYPPLLQASTSPVPPTSSSLECIQSLYDSACHSP